MKIDKLKIVSLLILTILFFSFVTYNINAETLEVEREKKTIYVPKDFKTIKEALQDAKKGDKVYIDGGKYEEPDGLSLRKGVEIYGSPTAATTVTLGAVGINLFGDNKVYDISFNLKSGQISVYCADNVIIKNCIISGGGDCGVYVEKGENVEIINCVIANFQYGILFRYPPTHVLVKNSIIAYNKQYGLYISIQNEVAALDMFGKPMTSPKQGGGEIKVESEYNDIWGSSQNYYGIQAGKYDMSKDPKFVDISKGDFHLRTGSPCIGAGDPDPKYNNPDGTRNDIGAFPLKENK